MRKLASNSYSTSTTLNYRTYNSVYNKTEVKITFALSFSGGSVQAFERFQTGVALKGSSSDFIMQTSASSNTLSYKHLPSSLFHNALLRLEPNWGLSGKSEFNGLYIDGSKNFLLQRSTTIYVAYADGNVRNMGISTGAAQRGIVWSGVGISFSTSVAAGVSFSLSFGWIELAKYYRSYTY